MQRNVSHFIKKKKKTTEEERNSPSSFLAQYFHYIYLQYRCGERIQTNFELFLVGSFSQGHWAAILDFMHIVFNNK